MKREPRADDPIFKKEGFLLIMAGVPAMMDLGDFGTRHARNQYPMIHLWPH